MLINKDNSLLIIIDVQEKLAPAMENPREIINQSKKLVDVANILNIPYIITEQYPKGLGQTIFDIKEATANNTKFFEKTAFSCYKDTSIKDAIKSSKKKQIIITGLETHICVTQTAIDLQNNGYDVFVAADACGSRDLFQTSLAFQRLMQNNISITSTEMIIFEWLEDATHKNFKEISKNHI